jgi:hypothetical protein
VCRPREPDGDRLVTRSALWSAYGCLTCGFVGRGKRICTLSQGVARTAGRSALGSNVERMTLPAPGQAAQPSPAIMSRLAFVRLFFQQGIDQSLQPEPLNVGSVLTLQDTAELFLQVVAEYRGIKLPRFVSFPEYWKLLDRARDPNGVALSGERPMTRLNDLRTAFKHHGTLPSATAVAQACTDVRAFLEANTLTVFGMPFDTIDMVEVIPQTGVRDKVRAATAAAGGGDLTEAMGLLAEAHDELFAIAPASAVPSRIARFGDTIRPVAERDTILEYNVG